MAGSDGGGKKEEEKADVSGDSEDFLLNIVENSDNILFCCVSNTFSRSLIDFSAQREVNDGCVQVCGRTPGETASPRAGGAADAAEGGFCRHAIKTLISIYFFPFKTQTHVCPHDDTTSQPRTTV